MWDKAWRRPATSEPRFQPRIGRPFDLEEVHVIDARTRGFLSRVIAVGAGGAVAITGAYGMISGNYIAVEVAGPWLVRCAAP